MVFFKEPDLDGELYPHWAIVLSWLIAMFPMFAMVAWFLYQYCYIDGAFGVSGIFILYQYCYIDGAFGVSKFFITNLFSYGFGRS